MNIFFIRFSQSKTANNNKQDPYLINDDNTDHTPSNVSNKFDDVVGVFDTFGGNFKDELAKSCNKAMKSDALDVYAKQQTTLPLARLHCS